MKALVLSDSHGDFYNVNKILQSQPGAEVVFFLGDGLNDIERCRLNYPEKMFITVRGNCDWGSDAPIEQFFSIEGKKIMATHGHAYNVKFTYSEAIYHARENKCEVLLFGHTHNAVTAYDHGLYIMNPGSAHGYGATYGLLDITQQGVMTNIVKVK